MPNDKTGGPAFPVAAGNTLMAEGMTLRDYFAAAALPAVITASVEVSGELMQVISQQQQAEMAFKYAAAMLAAREK